jgi:hypothetical protein
MFFFRADANFVFESKQISKSHPVFSHLHSKENLFAGKFENLVKKLN